MGNAENGEPGGRRGVIKRGGKGKEGSATGTAKWITINSDL